MRTFWDGGRRADGGEGGTARGRRRHGEVIGPPARRQIERDGWRTNLQFFEQRNRARDGKLVAVEHCWTAEAQRFDGEMVMATATASHPDLAWTELLQQIRRGEVTHHRRVRFA